MIYKMAYNNNKSQKKVIRRKLRIIEPQKKIPSMVVWGSLINNKFADYHKDYRRNNIDGLPCVYLLNMWLPLRCDFWRFLLEHYKVHIYGHYKYHEIKEKRASNKIKRFFKSIERVAS